MVAPRAVQWSFSNYKAHIKGKALWLLYPWSISSCWSGVRNSMLMFHKCWMPEMAVCTSKKDSTKHNQPTSWPSRPWSFILTADQREGTLISSIVQAAAQSVGAYEGTVIDEFVWHHKSSWQAHLEWISNYLVHGPDIWWNDNSRSYVFHDGDHDPNTHPLGPKLHHFRSSTIEDVLREKSDL